MRSFVVVMHGLEERILATEKGVFTEAHDGGNGGDGDTDGHKTHINMSLGLEWSISPPHL